MCVGMEFPQFVVSCSTFYSPDRSEHIPVKERLHFLYAEPLPRYVPEWFPLNETGGRERFDGLVTGLFL